MSAHVSNQNKVYVLQAWGAGLRRGEAAKYCGHSSGHFDKLVKEGVYPQGRNAIGVTVWLRGELDSALYELPIEGSERVKNSCDKVFGL